MFFETIRDKSVYRRRMDNLCSPHFHKSIELLYVTRGEKRVNVGGNEYTLAPHDLLVVPPCELHHYFPADGGEQIVLCIPPSFCERFSKMCERAYPSEFVYHDEKVELFSLFDELSRNSSELFLEGAANLILSRFIDNIPLAPRESGKERVLVMKIFEYIEKHYAEELSLSDISAHFGYSKNYFSYLFKKNFSMGYTSYLNNIRVYKSLKYLKDHSIYEISLKCGFKSPQQYHLNFKKLYGCTPKQYIDG